MPRVALANALRARVGALKTLAFALFGGSVTLVGCLFALVGQPLALFGQGFALFGSLVASIGLPFAGIRRALSVLHVLLALRDRTRIAVVVALSAGHHPASPSRRDRGRARRRRY